jgi:hypothetical protein
MAGNHVEDHLSLPAASSLGRRKYPLLPSTEFFRARFKKARLQWRGRWSSAPPPKFLLLSFSYAKGTKK